MFIHIHIYAYVCYFVLIICLKYHHACFFSIATSPWIPHYPFWNTRKMDISLSLFGFSWAYCLSATHILLHSHLCPTGACSTVLGFLKRAATHFPLRTSCLDSKRVDALNPACLLNFAHIPNSSGDIVTNARRCLYNMLSICLFTAVPKCLASD